MIRLHHWKLQLSDWRGTQGRDAAGVDLGTSDGDAAVRGLWLGMVLGLPRPNPADSHQERKIPLSKAMREVLPPRHIDNGLVSRKRTAVAFPMGLMSSVD